jgi:uncharacterized membrane protein
MVTVPLKSWFATACCALGLGLSLYLSLLKFYSLPCAGPGNCHAVIHSAYGSVYRIPAGAFGALLWAAAILVPDRTKRGVLLLLLSAGAAIFMGIQFFVLKTFCLYCTLHALAAWTALALHGQEPRRFMALVLAGALAAGGFSLTRQHIATHASTAVPDRGRWSAAVAR